MIARMFSIAVYTAMSNHTYRFDGKVYQQEDGGPIGDELAQAVARIVMIWWDRKFLELCSNLGLEMLMYLRYVDDTNKAIIPPPLGSRFINGELQIDPILAVEDEARPRDKVVGTLLRSVANSISPMLQFEDDVPSNHEDGRLPILDLKVWVEVAQDGRGAEIRHTFFKKPMASKMTLLARTAFPNSQIRVIMVEEVLRRLRNCDPQASWEERGRHLTAFAVSMKSSGHTEHFRKTVFNKAVSRFCHELDAHEAGAADIYRSREERERQLALKGGKSIKDSWFRKGVDDERVTSILRVPYTPGGALKEQITSSLEGNSAPKGFKTKIQEDGGLKLRFCLMKSDPFPRANCGRSTCPLTRGEQECGEKCFQAHCNYVALCNRCDPPEVVNLASSTTPHCAATSPRTSPAAAPLEMPPTPEQDPEAAADGADVDVAQPRRQPLAMYCGESSRGCNKRYKEHVSSYKAHKGFMWDHVEKVHNGVQGEDPANDFYMKLHSVDRDPIRRVVRESIRIKNAREREDEGGGPEVLNDKGEWFGVKVVTAEFKQE